MKIGNLLRQTELLFRVAAQSPYLSPRKSWHHAELSLRSMPPLMKKLEQDFSNVIDRMNKSVTDDGAGRRFRLLILPDKDILTGAPEINVKIGYCSPLEEKAMRFYASKEGCTCRYYPGENLSEPTRNDLSWNNLRKRFFCFSVPVTRLLDQVTYSCDAARFSPSAPITHSIDDVLLGLKDHFWGPDGILCQQNIAFEPAIIDHRKAASPRVGSFGYTVR